MQNTIYIHPNALAQSKLSNAGSTMPGPPQKGRKRPRSDKGQQDKGKNVSNGTAKTKQQIRSVERLLRKEVNSSFCSLLSAAPASYSSGLAHAHCS